MFLRSRQAISSERNVQDDGNMEGEEVEGIYRLDLGSRVGKVEKNDVAKISEELKYKLRNQGIELKDIGSYLFSEENEKSQSISVKELEQRFCAYFDINI
jgi:hypothetical protein